jgi:hypothetical protein
VNVVSDENASLDKLLEEGHNLSNGRGIRNHTVGDAGKPGDERLYSAIRVDERGELIHDLPPH